MKYAGKIKNRLLKKLLGTSDYKKLLAVSKLKPGDVYNTYYGFNDVVVKLKPLFTNLFGNPHVLYDFIVIGKNSNEHLCELTKLKSQIEVMEYWCDFANRSDSYYYSNTTSHIVNYIKQGINPFDEKGCIKDEYSIPNHRRQSTIRLR